MTFSRFSSRKIQMLTSTGPSRNTFCYSYVSSAIASVGCRLRGLHEYGVCFDNFSELGAVSAQCAGGVKHVIRRQDKIAPDCTGIDLNQLRFQMLVVPGKQIEARNIIGRHQPLNLIEDGEGIEWTQLRFQVIRRQPYRVAVGFAGLLSTGLAEVGADAFAERD